MNERKTQAALLRDIVGNPFKSQAVSHLPSARDVALDIYRSRAFDKLPQLADALEKYGCNNAKILGHCWLPGPHVRGCWVVDLMLGRE
ncbi:MAG: hypothetical protein HY040_15440 [Planctomycetes bacterium]|nr:hypothetical protein [Planctomycetota bacterium]